MSDSDSAGAHGLRHHTQAVCFPAANVYPVRISPTPPPGDRDNVFSDHPGQTFHGSPVPSTMGASATRVQSDPQTYTYFGADQVNLDPQVGGLSVRQTPINSHPRVRSSDATNYATVFPPRNRELRACLLGHMAPTIHGRDVSDQLSAYHPALPTSRSITNVHSHVYLSNWQTATPPPGSITHTLDSQISSSTSAFSPQSSLPAFGDASPTVASSPALKEKGPKKRLLATAICPFPHCLRKSGRPQELERHVLRHLPHWISCTQPGCDWTGYRRDLLRDHLKKEHRDVSFLERVSEGIKVYDAKRLVKQLLKKKITVEQAECEAHAAFRKRGVTV